MLAPALNRVPDLLLLLHNTTWF